MPIARITPARFQFRFIYLQADAMALVNRPQVRFFPGPNALVSICSGTVCEEANPAYGRARCVELYTGPIPQDGLADLPLQLGDEVHYVVRNGDVYLTQIVRGQAPPAPPQLNQNPSPASGGGASVKLPGCQASCNDLIAIGFEDVAQWKIDTQGKLMTVGDNQNNWNDLSTKVKQALYVFCIDGVPVYVGKTINTIAVRFSGYRSATNTQSTNQKNQNNMIDAIKAGKTVRILILPNRTPLMWGKYPINIAAGLEDALIDDLQPDWNT